MRRVRRKSPLDFILPFLIILSVGVIVVLCFQDYNNFVKQGKSDAYFYVADGKAKVLPYGKTEWDNAYSGTKLLLGDAVKTIAQGKVVVKFYNGTLVRLGDDTSLLLSDLTKQFDSEKLSLTLNKGITWIFCQRSPDIKSANFELRTTHLKVKTQGKIVEIEDTDTEKVRVLDGSASVDIMVGTTGGERVAETVSVGVGQQLVLDQAALKAFENNQNPSVLTAVDDQFKQTTWYAWNMSQDKNPTDFSLTVDQNALNKANNAPLVTSTQAVNTQQNSSLGSQQVNEGLNTQQGDLGNDDQSAQLTAPVVAHPTGDEVNNTTGKSVISGTVGANVAKVMVMQVKGGKQDTYALSKFKKGDSAWSYNVSAALGNMQEGDNTYYFYAVDGAGNKSENAKVVITYTKAKVTGTLTAPKVTKYNGASSNEVTKNSVKIEGTVGDSAWSYIASETLGNLKAGENEFNVYAEDSDGNKSEVTKFTVNYVKSSSDSSNQATQQVQKPTSSSQESTQAVQPGF